MLSYDPTLIIHVRNEHGGDRETCEKCIAIKAKFPNTTWTTKFPWSKKC